MSRATPNVVAIIQARMGSTRLPGKVLKSLEGETVLARVLARTKRATTIGDVLVRYYRAAQFSKAEIVVRITSDCPLIDPEITDKTVNEFLKELPDYASNALTRTYPRGLDTEVFSVKTLECAWRESSEPYQRAHVTPYIYQHPERFKVLAVNGQKD